MNKLFTVFAIFSLFYFSACSIPASCDNSDYTGFWSGEMDCEILGQSEITLEISELNGGLTGIYNDNTTLTGSIEDCFVNLSGDLTTLRTIDISGTILLGNLSVTVNEVFLSDTVQICSANLN